MIDHYIGDVFIPDIVLELLAKNRVYENFDLYSDENKIFYEVRGSMLDRVIRDMLSEILNNTTEKIVNDYLRKRYTQKDISERDPLRLATNSIFDGVLRAQMKVIAKDALDALVLEYLIESQFNSLLNRAWIPRQVEHTIIDTVEDIAIGQLLDEYLEGMIREAAPLVVKLEIENERNRSEKEELEHCFAEFIDRCMLESVIENISRLYEEEEKETHFKEQTQKQLREEAKDRYDIAKVGYRNANEELEQYRNVRGGTNWRDQLEGKVAGERTPGRRTPIGETGRKGSNLSTPLGRGAGDPLSGTTGLNARELQMKYAKNNNIFD